MGGIQYVHTIYDLGIESEDLQIQQWIPYSVLPIGLVLLFFRFAQVIIKIIKGR
jgi:TRAP-type C4-dicarboxylate transport system permease small subunit